MKQNLIMYSNQGAWRDKHFMGHTGYVPAESAIDCSPNGTLTNIVLVNPDELMHQIDSWGPWPPRFKQLGYDQLARFTDVELLKVIMDKHSITALIPDAITIHSFYIHEEDGEVPSIWLLCTLP